MRNLAKEFPIKHSLWPPEWLGFAESIHASFQTGRFPPKNIDTENIQMPQRKTNGMFSNLILTIKCIIIVVLLL